MRDRVPSETDRSCVNDGGAQAGFTLVEVFVAILISAATIIAISTLTVMSMKNTSKSRQMTSAVSLGQGLADSIRSVRPQDVASVPWNLDQLTDSDGASAVPLGAPSGSSRFLVDLTCPNPGYRRYYRVECPPESLCRADSIQVTVRVVPIIRGNTTGRAFGYQDSGEGTTAGSARTTDVIFFVQDPTINLITGTGGINGGTPCC